MSADWTMELLQDSSIADALALIDPALAQRAKQEMDDLAHAAIDGPAQAMTERGTPYVSIVGSSVKPEGMVIEGDQIVAQGNPIILTQADVNAAAERAVEVWLKGDKEYRRSVCEKAGTGAHIVLVWRVHPTFIMWSEWGHTVRLAMRGRLAFETIEAAEIFTAENYIPCASHAREATPAAPDFLALNKAFSQ
jgi:hypothetical protein